MKLAIHAYAAVLASISITALAQDAVQWRVEDGGNGHWYLASSMEESISWDDARLASEYIGGHLATLTSQAESQLVVQLLDGSMYSPYGPWLGAFQDHDAPDYSEPDGGWAWVTGEAWTWTNWSQDEPNDLSCSGFPEDWLQFDFIDRGTTWNDLELRGDESCAFASAYVIEWSADCNGDGIVDYGQILDGTFEDLDGNGVPDCCENSGDCGCRVDLTEDGEVNTLDFLLYLGAWSQRDPLADWDGNGTINTLDFLAFLNEWTVGC